MIGYLQWCCQAHRWGRTLFSTIIPGHLHIFGRERAWSGNSPLQASPDRHRVFLAGTCVALLGAWSAVDIWVGWGLSSCQYSRGARLVASVYFANCAEVLS